MSEEFAQVVHKLPWRIRVGARALVRQRSACERLAKQLASEMEVDSISVRPFTGSIVIVRMTGNLDAEAIARRISELIALERDEAGEPLATKPKQRVDTSRLARAVVQTVEVLNSRVSDALDGEADLRTLAPLVLLAASLLEVPASGKLPPPPWSALLWYAIRSFMTFNEGAVESRSPAS